MRLPSARWPAAGGALLLLAASVLSCRQEVAARRVLLQRWESSGAATAHPTLGDRARRDPDPRGGATALARVLFADAFDSRALAGLPRAEAALEARRVEQRLGMAAELSRAHLLARPASWQSAMLLGGARLLADWRRGDAALYEQPQRWQAPLAQARFLAPGSPEPRRLLVTGYLATWQALSADERAAGRRLVRDVFRDRDTLNQLLPAWAAVAGSRAELESVLPAEPGPYDLLQRTAAGQRDWVGFCAARERWLPLTLAALRLQLEGAERRFSGGDTSGGRNELLAVATAAPPDRRTAPLFSAAIERLPATQIGGGQASAIGAWLSWALPLWQLGQESLPPAVLARLATLSPDLPPAQAAMAALAGGDFDRAELLARRSDRLWSEEWAAYATAKAEALLARGHFDEAAGVLDEVHRTYRERWTYLRARERLAGARSEPLTTRPESLGASLWGPEQWLFRGDAAALDVVAARGANGLTVEVDVAPDGGAVIELAWDGLGLGCVPVRQGEVLRLPVVVTSGPHQLVWRSLAGGRTTPGTAELAGGDR